MRYVIVLVAALLANIVTAELSSVTLNLTDKDVHNEALTTKTLVTVEGYPDTCPNSYPTVAGEGLTAAKSKLESGKQFVPTANTHTEAQLLAALPTATVFFAFTHGEWDGLYPKDITEFVGWNEMAGAPLQSTIFPGRNLAFFYACSTASSGYAAPAALGMMAGESTYRQNVGVAGFPQVLWSLLKAGDSTATISGLYAATKLHAHTSKLPDDLLSGVTLGQAVQNANDDFPPRTAIYPIVSDPPELYHMEMKVKGDPLARLRKVYKGGDLIIEEEEDWYLVYMMPQLQI